MRVKRDEGAELDHELPKGCGQHSEGPGRHWQTFPLKVPLDNTVGKEWVEWDLY